MSALEFIANALTLLSVVLSVKLKRSLYPIGLAATAAFFFVFWQSHLFASAALQVYFTVIQLYGWWYWSKGFNGGPPPIGDWTWPVFFGIGAIAGAVTIPVAWIVSRFTSDSMPVLDTAILVLSIFAQFLLDRKQRKTWLVWAVVDGISIFVYGQQGLILTSAVYALLLLNVGWGWWEWRRVFAAQQAAASPEPA